MAEYFAETGSFDSGPSALIFADTEAGGLAAAESVRVAGGRLAGRLGLEDAVDRLNRQAAVEAVHRQSQTRAYLVFDGCKMGCLKLLPDAGSHIATGDAVVQHGDAGAANHGIELVTNHKLGQCAPQCHDHADGRRPAGSARH